VAGIIDDHLAGADNQGELPTVEIANCNEASPRSLEAEAAGVGGRIRLPGVQIGDDLAHAYAAADVLVLASRAEAYGVVPEALGQVIQHVAPSAPAGGPCWPHPAGAQPTRSPERSTGTRAS
jgi:glycosyltransferase involved in cell wall biosynthesis